VRRPSGGGGETLVILEAMKMEMSIAAPVEACSFHSMFKGQMVMPGQTLYHRQPMSGIMTRSAKLFERFVA
jgi:hypothetical protein